MHPTCSRRSWMLSNGFSLPHQFLNHLRQGSLHINVYAHKFRTFAAAIYCGEKQSVDIPTCFAPFGDIFCLKKASQLPPHRPWDCTIDLIPGEPVPRGRGLHGTVFLTSVPARLYPATTRSRYIFAVCSPAVCF